MAFLSAYYSQKGPQKPANQDGLLIKTARTKLGEIGLFVVCDGMGGLDKGELASATVIRGLSSWFSKQLPQQLEYGVESDQIWASLEQQVHRLNEKIVNYGENNHVQLGTTLTALLVIDQHYYLAQVGDSRAYQLNDAVKQLTEDQSLVAREVARGSLTKEEAQNHPKRHVLLQCIGVQSTIKLAVSHAKCQVNDTFLLCTDGFYHQLTEAELQLYLIDQTIATRESGNEAVKQLAKRIVKRGEVDDLSAIFVRKS
ncbi:Serine/threonine protein phosphatase PrpC [Amphibacillus marinus]|uniref:Serine/threonine protein phosphatase PrpC n=1 Tax=Amphibacillus marinus TaxID=872970 RepID=A0A1H8R3X9_9BACI|nr:protein phosphatase 2C domain-containing protein [Amphibacillus marinus]SEO61046.1 Serine/threonine protein phosphatase PrpC [Amphibacillus marinus]